jgi:predicted DNA-binding transcriptional regulator AlpA
MAQKIEAQWLSGTQVAAFFNVTVMTIWRWERDPKLDFPQPNLINDRKYWSRDSIDAWMRQRPNKTVKVA